MTGAGTERKGQVAMDIDDTSFEPGSGEIAGLLACWDVTLSGRVEEICPEGIYRLSSEHGEALILKDMGSIDDQVLSQLAFETEVLLHLQNAGLPVAVPLADRQGRLAVPWKDHYYILSPCLPNDGGVLVAADRAQHLRNYGAAIAGMHRALATFPQEGLPEGIGRIDLASEVFDTGFPIIMGYLTGQQAEAFGTISAGLKGAMPAAFQGLPEQLIHRDCHAENLLSCGTEITGIVDWDHLTVGPRILDIAYFAVQIAKRQVRYPEAMARWLDDVPLLLAGYEAESALVEEEKAAFPYVLIAVPVLFAYWAIETGHSDDYIQTELDTLAWFYGNLDVIQVRVQSH